MRRSFVSLLVTAAALLIAIPAFAADNGFYLGGSVGQTAINTGDLGQVQVDGTTTGYKVFAGVRILTFAAVEGSYIDFGKTKEQTTTTTSGEAKATGYQLQAMGMLPLGIADIFVKAGMTSWQADVNGTSAGIPTSVSKDGTDPVYGVGVQFRVKSFAIRGEVEYFDVKSADQFYFYSIGASYTF